MILKGLERVKKLYFIGIGGVSMSALAKLCAVNGYAVSGSDAVRSENTENLAFYGIKVYFGEDKNGVELAEADAVVYTDAIPENHPERQKAEILRKRIFPRAEFLSLISSSFQTVLAIAGSHGKTTCTSMCAHILKALNVPFTAHIGGQDTTFGNFYSSGREYFLTEACEYKKNLLKLKPDVAVLLNIDLDHMECYKTETELSDCFRDFCASAQTAFVCADDTKCENLGEFPSFGLRNPLADYRAVDIRANGERYSFTVEEYGKPLCRIRLRAIGKCNVYNALAAFSAIRSLGFNEKDIKRGLESFEAVKRRFERVGFFHGASVVCDYAHHPREIASTIATAKGICKGDLYVVFQPHTYSRTRLLMREFVETLRSVKNLMIYKTFPAREKFDSKGSAETLAENIGGCLYAENVYVLKTWLKKTVKESDAVLFLGAGDIYYVAQYLVKQE